MSNTTQGETLTNPADIQRLMRTVQNEMIAVTLVFSDSRRTLSTYLIEVDAKNGRMLLDEPMPRGMAVELASGAPFSLEAQVDGVHSRAEQLSAGAAPLDGGEPGFICPLPRVLLSSQRRRSFRAPVRRTLHIDAQLRDEAGQQADGWLRDMSVDGCGVSLHGDQRSIFTELGSQWAVRLSFPNQSHLDCRVNLQRIGFEEANGVTQLGCRFESMPAQAHTEIAALVTDLQRDRINFLKKGGRVEDIPARFLSPTGDATTSPPPANVRPARPSAPERRRATAAEEEADAGPETVWRNALAAVRKQRQNNRAEPIDDLTEALRRLTACWRRQRQLLTLISRLRSADNTEIEQSLASALLLADHQARSRGGASDVFLRTLTLAVLKRLDATLKPLATLVAALDTLAFRAVDGQVFYQPTAAYGALHKQGKTEAEGVRVLIATQGIYPLGAPVRLDNDCIALILRQSDAGQPLWVRQVYRLSDPSPLPPKDLHLEDAGLSVTGPADPVKTGLSVELLRPPLRR